MKAKRGPAEASGGEGLLAIGRKTRVLVFPCGAENATEIHQALRYSIHVELFGASSADDHGRFRFANYRGGLPRIQSPDFDSAFASLVKEWGIDLVFATHDSVLEYLAPRAEEMGYFLVNGDPETARVTRRKSATYSLFADRPWSPRVYRSPEAVSEWPAVVKPDLGQGGQGVAVVGDATAAARAMAGVSEPLLVEYLPGEELSIDCFTDRKSELVWIGPRSRERVRAGIAMRSAMLAPDPAIEAIAAEINRRLKLRGPWFFQVKRDAQGEWKLLEICGGWRGRWSPSARAASTFR